MPVMMIAEVPTMTDDVYAGMIGQLSPVLQAAKGFIAHGGGPSPAGGWRVVELWETQDDGDAWYDDNVKPNLPPGMEPDRTYHPLHSAFGK